MCPTQESYLAMSYRVSFLTFAYSGRRQSDPRVHRFPQSRLPHVPREPQGQELGVMPRHEVLAASSDWHGHPPPPPRPRPPAHKSARGKSKDSIKTISTHLDTLPLKSQPSGQVKKCQVRT